MYNYYETDPLFTKTTGYILYIFLNFAPVSDGKYSKGNIAKKFSII